MEKEKEVFYLKFNQFELDALMKFISVSNTGEPISVQYIKYQTILGIISNKIPENLVSITRKDVNNKDQNNEDQRTPSGDIKQEKLSNKQG